MRNFETSHPYTQEGIATLVFRAKGHVRNCAQPPQVWEKLGSPGLVRPMPPKLFLENLGLRVLGKTTSQKCCLYVTFGPHWPRAHFRYPEREKVMYSWSTHKTNLHCLVQQRKAMYTLSPNHAGSPRQTVHPEFLKILAYNFLFKLI